MLLVEVRRQVEVALLVGLQLQRYRDEVSEGCNFDPGLVLGGVLVSDWGTVLVPLVALGDGVWVPLLRVSMAIEPCLLPLADSLVGQGLEQLRFDQVGALVDGSNQGDVARLSSSGFHPQVHTFLYFGAVLQDQAEITVVDDRSPLFHHLFADLGVLGAAHEGEHVADAVGAHLDSGDMVQAVREGAFVRGAHR